MFGSQKSGFGSAGFGSSSTFGGSSGGSLFGSNTQTSQSNSLFGNTANNTNNTGGGLYIQYIFEIYLNMLLFEKYVMIRNVLIK